MKKGHLFAMALALGSFTLVHSVSEDEFNFMVKMVRVDPSKNLYYGSTDISNEIKASAQQDQCTQLVEEKEYVLVKRENEEYGFGRVDRPCTNENLPSVIIDKNPTTSKQTAIKTSQVRTFPNHPKTPEALVSQIGELGGIDKAAPGYQQPENDFYYDEELISQ